jgi:UDP-N-acetylmuramyl pentapeptide phosphotransferase/UDP-N-acetylglucosamine-1-phosphate transferase
LLPWHDGYQSHQPTPINASGTSYAQCECTPRRSVRQKPSCGGLIMLWTIVVILLILWALGLFVGTVGNLIHILLVIAIIVVLVRVIQGRRPI